MFTNYGSNTGYKSGRAKTAKGLHTSHGFLPNVKAPEIRPMQSSQDYEGKVNRIAAVVAVLFLLIPTGFYVWLSQLANR